MQATITSKGQITIPRAIRERLNLKQGDKLEFDEQASLLKARRVIDSRAWKDLRKVAQDPWPSMGSREVLDELRGMADVPPVRP
jgi:AbrB family looped-hinge helix DNA binding protein